MPRSRLGPFSTDNPYLCEVCEGYTKPQGLALAKGAVKCGGCGGTGIDASGEQVQVPLLLLHELWNGALSNCSNMCIGDWSEQCPEVDAVAMLLAASKRVSDVKCMECGKFETIIGPERSFICAKCESKPAPKKIDVINAGE